MKKIWNKILRMIWPLLSLGMVISFIYLLFNRIFQLENVFGCWHEVIIDCVNSCLMLYFSFFPFCGLILITLLFKDFKWLGNIFDSLMN